MEQGNHNSPSSTPHPQFGEFDEIRPYEASEMRQAFDELLADRQFNTILKGFAPWLPKGMRNSMLRLAFTGVKTPLDFQLRFMKPVVWHIVRKHTDGLTFDDKAMAECCEESVINTPELPDADNGTAQGNQNYKLDTINYKLDKRYTFVSNHRDIVLDSAFLDILLNKHGYPTTVEIGIGDNLLIYPWIKRLVRMNKAFTVRRGLTAHEMMRSSQLMSRYIHYAVTQKHENIWIAQREGRAKDSSDQTQEAVLKMLAMGGELSELNIVPLTISYEYDPCDYLKAQEMQLKRDDPGYKKSRQDDLDNMRIGILGYKGRVHYHCGTPINQWLPQIAGLPRNLFFAQLASRMDREIHAGYRLFPGNYIAYDMLHKGKGQQASSDSTQDGLSDNNGNQNYKPFTDHYTPHDCERFEHYLEGQLAKISIPGKDEAFLRERMLTMYANPVRNYLATL